MHIKMCRLLLTKTKFANIEENDFGAYKQLTLGNVIWEDELDEDIVIYHNDIDFIGDASLIKIRAINDDIIVEKNEIPQGVELYYFENSDPGKALEITDEQTIISENDMIAILVPEYFPKEIYGGSEGLFYITFDDGEI